MQNRPYNTFDLSGACFVVFFFFSTGFPAWEKGIYGAGLGDRLASRNEVSQSVDSAELLFLFCLLVLEQINEPFPKRPPKIKQQQNQQEHQQPNNMCVGMRTEKKEREQERETTFHGDILLCYVLFCYFCRGRCRCFWHCCAAFITTKSRDSHNRKWNRNFPPINAKAAEQQQRLWQRQSTMISFWPALIAKHLPRPTANNQRATDNNQHHCHRRRRRRRRRIEKIKKETGEKVGNKK